MSLYNGPARGGNRGGKDQFNWESVKSDKDREFYLGHSVKATTGRWQKGEQVEPQLPLCLVECQPDRLQFLVRQGCVLVHTRKGQGSGRAGSS